MLHVFNYFRRVGIAISVLFNVMIGGHSNQTFSARNWAWKREGKPNLVSVIDAICFWDSHHCAVSWSYWFIRKEIK